ncbi:hypothetical protein N7530_011451 [Penicillium desertorum]|uniref:Uncharacterized protein n=1 Tax=Penicillium desertorum TaxID=1303715 RepID=A0A9X0BFN1_9EURO|nr:hypothetical protein N7530_011451 [Penicillium desertorum]
MNDEADDFMEGLDQDENKDTRPTQRRFDKYTEKVGELSDSEDEEEKTANGIRRQPGTVRRRKQLSYRTLDSESRLDSICTTTHDTSSVDDTDIAAVRA